MDLDGRQVSYGGQSQTLDFKKFLVHGLL
jgi:hypothetical protein